MVNSISGSGRNTPISGRIADILSDKVRDPITHRHRELQTLAMKVIPASDEPVRTTVSLDAMDAVDKAILKTHILPLVQERTSLTDKLQAAQAEAGQDIVEKRNEIDEIIRSLSEVDVKLSEFRGTAAYNKFLYHYAPNGNPLT